MIDNTYSVNGRKSYPEIVATGNKPIAADQVARQVAKNIFLVNALAAHRGFRYMYILQPNLPTTGKGLSPQEKARLAEWDKERIQYFRECYAAINDSIVASVPDFIIWMAGHSLISYLKALPSTMTPTSRVKPPPRKARDSARDFSGSIARSSEHNQGADQGHPRARRWSDSASLVRTTQSLERRFS